MSKGHGVFDTEARHTVHASATQSAESFDSEAILTCSSVSDRRQQLAPASVTGSYGDNNLLQRLRVLEPSCCVCL